MAIIIPAKFYRDPSTSFQAHEGYENSCQGCEHDVEDRQDWPNGQVKVSYRCKVGQRVHPKGNAQNCNWWEKKRGW